MASEKYRDGTGKQQLVTGLLLFFSIMFIIFGRASWGLFGMGLLCTGLFIYFYKKWNLKWEWSSDWGV